jgi:hypothetical protein
MLSGGAVTAILEARERRTASVLRRGRDALPSHPVEDHANQGTRDMILLRGMPRGLSRRAADLANLSCGEFPGETNRTSGVEAAQVAARDESEVSRLEST